jgi:hypothetical protein
MAVSLGRDTLYLAVMPASSPNLQNGQSRAKRAEPSRISPVPAENVVKQGS